jgi:hypothetical protein
MPNPGRKCTWLLSKERSAMRRLPAVTELIWRGCAEALHRADFARIDLLELSA